MKTLSHPIETLKNLEPSEFCFEISSATGTLEIEKEDFYLAFNYGVQTDYNDDEVDLGYRGGFFVTKVYSEFSELLDGDGDEIKLSETEKRSIERLLDSKLDLTCYGRDF